MPARYHDDIELLSAGDVERIHRVTDGFELQRNCVVVPLNCAAEGKAIVLPDGNLLIRAPSGGQFEPWIEDLRIRLGECDLSRTPRRSEKDPKRHLTGTHGPTFSGTRGYLERQPDLNVMEGPTPAGLEAVEVTPDESIDPRNDRELKEAHAVLDR